MKRTALALVLLVPILSGLAALCAVPAQAQTVAAISRAQLGPGQITSPTFTVPARTVDREVTLAINATGWNNSDLIVTFTIERSDDGGGTWRHWSSATSVGGSLSRSGALPSQSFVVPANETFLVRAILTLNQQANIGLNLTVN